MSQLILGIGHKARHGKDSFARAVEDYFANLNTAVVKHGHGRPVIVQRNAFADAIRRETNAFLNTPQGNAFATGAPEVFVDGEIRLPDWVKPDPNPEVTPQTPLGKHPKLLQWWGTEYRRAQDEHYWVKQWKAAVSPFADIVLVTDMRFHNEAMAILEMGGYTVNVTRLQSNGLPFVDSSRPADHISEICLDHFNYDYEIRSKDLVWTGEVAVTLVHFLRARASKGK